MQGGVTRKTFKAGDVVIIKDQFLELVESFKSFDSHDLVALQLEDLQLLEAGEPFELYDVVMPEMKVDNVGNSLELTYLSYLFILKRHQGHLLEWNTLFTPQGNSFLQYRLTHRLYRVLL
jgi:hypothetical protein